MNQIAAESIHDIVVKVRALRKKSEFASAIDILKAATQDNISDTQQARTIARLYSDLQRPDLAIATLMKGGFAENPQVLADLAVYHELVGDFKQAEALINDCIDLEPDPLEPQLVLARVLEHQGEYDRALRLVHHLLQHNRIDDPRPQFARSINWLNVRTNLATTPKPTKQRVRPRKFKSEFRSAAAFPTGIENALLGEANSCSDAR